MRTLKKTLCLVMAIVMILGLSAFSVSAADYSDDASISADYKEAVSVLSEIGVLTGKDNGSYEPQSSLTRIEGCYIITKMLGVTSPSGTTSFTDVSATDAPYVAYCQAVGITDGYGDNTFHPYDELTYAAFAKWCLTALGYNAAVEGMTGTNWTSGVATLVTHTGLSNGVKGFNLNGSIKREEAAQIGLNTLKTTMVEYSGGVNVTTDTGTDVTVNAARSYVTTARGNAWANAIYTTTEAVSNARYVELGELVYGGDLRLLSTTDDFGAPAEQWTYNARALTDPVTKDALVTYTGSKTNAAGKSAVRGDLTGFYGDATIKIYLNGDEIDGVSSGAYVANSQWNGPSIKTNLGNGSLTVQELIADLTANGREVAVYNNNSTYNQLITDIVIKQYDLFEVTSKLNKTVTLTRRTAGDFVTAAISGLATYNFTYSTAVEGNTITATDSKNADFYSELNALNNKDFVLLAIKANGASASDEIVEIGEFKTAEGAFTNYGSNKYTVGGTEYNAATNSSTTTIGSGSLNGNAVDGGTEYTLYLDPTGTALLYSKEKTNNTKTYAQILNLSRDGSAQGGFTYSARLLFTDGSIKWVTVNKLFEGTDLIKPGDSSSVNNFTANGGGTWNKYFVQYQENSDGTYNFVNAAPTAGTASTAGGATTITKGSPNMTIGGTPNAATLTSKTVVLVKNSSSSYTSYTGIANIPSITSSTADAFLVYCESGTIANLIIVDPSVGNVGVTGKEVNYLVFYDYAHRSSTVSGDDTIYTYKAIVDGADTTVQSTKNIPNGIYTNAVFDADGLLTSTGTQMHVDTASDGDTKLGTAINTIGIYDSSKATGNVKAYVADSVLHFAAFTTAVYSIVTAEDGTMSQSQSAAINLPVADDFVVYVVKADQSRDNLTQISLGSKATADSYTTGIISGGFDTAILTTNEDGEATALYITANSTGLSFT